MKNVIKLQMIIGLISVFLMSCSPEDGDTGPQGPQGPQGEQGLPGTDGTDGVDGMDGNANVLASDWITITWEIDAFSGDTFADFTIVDERFTQEIVDSAAVLVYLGSTEFSFYFITLPITSPFTENTYYYQVNADETSLTLVANNDTGLVDFEGIDRVRYIILPSSTDVSSLESLDYKDIMTKFELEQ